MSLDTTNHIPTYRLLDLPGLKNPNSKNLLAETKVSPSLINWLGVMVSSVLEVLKKESKREYTNRAEKAFIDFPIGVSTN